MKSRTGIQTLGNRTLQTQRGEKKDLLPTAYWLVVLINDLYHRLITREVVSEEFQIIINS